MEWKDIWKEEPPRNEEIFFMTGDETIHIGEIFSQEKLRKCKFHSFNHKEDYECDLLTDFDDRVIYWFPIPKQPESSKREDHILIYKDENGNKTPIRDLFNPNYGCGTPNTMET